LVAFGAPKTKGINVDSSHPRANWRTSKKGLVALAVTAVLTAALSISAPEAAQAATSEPCDIYANAGTPCVAAHSMTRALFAGYDGPLYQVRRWSDNTTTNVGLLSTGGIANAATQNSFCAGTTCTVTLIYDQTANHNNLAIEGAGGNGGADAGANAAALPITVGGHGVYGLYVSAGVGYRDNSTVHVATGSAPEGEYMITSSTHINNRCCFDYGNAETSSDDTGNGHMDAINFGSEVWFTPSFGSGPWVQGDLENGLFAGANGSYSGNTGRSAAFVTAMLKNNGTTTYAIKDGNAQSGSLATRYSGALPTTSGYAPMHKEGAIVLGTGGDDSNGSVGSFFEGVMTAGYPSDATDNAVQANIVAAGYSTSSTFPVSGQTYTITNVSSGKVLDAVNCGTANGTVVDQWAALGNTCQRWTFGSVANNSFTITNVNSGKVLDAVNCGLADGTKVDLWSSLGNLCQQWQVVPDGNGSYEILPQNSGMTLDDTNCSASNGTAIDLWQWLDNTCQEWKITS
jgi:non-reducing end alpha-L-arabinofuranosidase